MANASSAALGSPSVCDGNTIEIGVLKEASRLLYVAGQMHPVLEAGRVNTGGEVRA